MWRALLLLPLLAACKPSVPTADAGATIPDGGDVTVRERLIRAKVTITVAAPPSPAVEAAVNAAFDEVQKLDDVISDWKEGSELGALNKRAGQGPMKVSPHMFELLSTARALSEASGGSFDVTFASLYGLWSFNPDAPKVPTKEEVAARLPLLDYRHLILDPKEQTAALGRPGVRVGLGGLSDGYAAHRASAVLAKAGFANHLVLVGGEGMAKGHKHGKSWRIAIRHPETGGFYGTVDIADEGVATSGNYEKFIVVDGVRYHHIIDPKTGFPARGTSSVTVIAKDALTADGWAKPLFIAGPKDGIAIAQEHGLEALWFDEEFKVSGTPKMLERVKKLP